MKMISLRTFLLGAFLSLGPGLPALATTIGTGQTVSDTAAAGTNVNFAATLDTSNPLYDTGAGVLSLSGNYSPGLGTGVNQVQWTGSGGFQASAAAVPNLQVNIAFGTTLSWGQLGFVPSGGVLVLDGNVTLVNGINLGTDSSATRQIDIGNSSRTGARFGAISGSGNLVIQAYGAPVSGSVHQVEIENSISNSGSLTINNVRAIVGIFNSTPHLINVSDINLTNGALLGDITAGGEGLRDGANLTLSGTSGYGLGASGNPATQTLGNLNSTDSTSIVYLGGTQSGGSGPVAVIPVRLTVNGGYYAGNIQDGSYGVNPASISNPGVGGSLVKSGSGTFTLAGSNDYIAGTTVQQGVLIASNTTGSATGTGAVLVQSGASLGGTGTLKISGTNTFVAQSGGKLDLTAYDPAHAPPSFTNTLTINLTPTSSATFASGATLAFDLGPGGTSDTIAFTGLTANLPAVYLNNNVVTLNFLSGAGPGTYTVMTFDKSGAYTGTLQSGANYFFTYEANDILVTVTPEPSTWVLVSGGLGGLVIFALRSRRQLHAT